MSIRKKEVSQYVLSQKHLLPPKAKNEMPMEIRAYVPLRLSCIGMILGCYYCGIMFLMRMVRRERECRVASWTS